MSQPTTMTYAAAQAILRAPRFADPEAIRARDLVARVDGAVELLGNQLITFANVCDQCGGSGFWRNENRGTSHDCQLCEASGLQIEGLNGAALDEALDAWAYVPPDARQEALRRARTARAKVKA